MANLPRVPVELLGKSSKVLGQGAYGTIHLHDCLSPDLQSYGLLQSKYALKISRERTSDDPTNETLIEIAVATTVHHPRLATAVAYCTYERKLCLIFEVYDTNLNYFLVRHVTKDVREQLARDVIEGVAILHANNISHNDISSGNIFIREEDGIPRAFIGDFGSCNVRSGQGESHMKLTTICYRPPEKFGEQWEPKDEKFDIWGLGCILFEILINSRLFPYTTASSMTLNFTERVGNPTEGEATFLQRCGLRLIPTLNISKLETSYFEPTIYLEITKSCLKYIPDERPAASELMAQLCEDYVPSIYKLPFRKLEDFSSRDYERLLGTTHNIVNFYLRLRDDNQSNPGQKIVVFEDTMVIHHRRLNDIFYLIEYIIRLMPGIVMNRETLSSLFYIANAINCTHFELSDLKESVGQTKVDLSVVIPEMVGMLKQDMVPITSYDYLCLSEFYMSADVDRRDYYARLLTLMLASGLRVDYSVYDMFKLLYERSSEDIKCIKKRMKGIREHNVWIELRLTYMNVRDSLFSVTS